MFDDKQNRPVSPQALFREAADLIERALSMLNTRHLKCEACGLPHYQDFKEYKAFSQFATVPGRLRQTSQLLDTK